MVIDLLKKSLMENFISCAVALAVSCSFRESLKSFVIPTRSHQSCFTKKGAIKILQSLQEKTLARVSFFIKMQASGLMDVKKLDIAFKFLAMRYDFSGFMNTGKIIQPSLVVLYYILSCIFSRVIHNIMNN